MKPALTAALAGLVFALGLGLGGMTDPARVLSFLDVTGHWNPSLAFVMGGALAVHAPLRWWIRRRRQAPLVVPAFSPDPPTVVDARLLSGASLFGVGWGLVGYCPGPALVALGTGTAGALTFGAGLVGGMALFQLGETVRAR